MMKKSAVKRNNAQIKQEPDENTDEFDEIFDAEYEEISTIKAILLEILDVLKVFIIGLIVFFLIRSFICYLTIVHGESMEPTLHNRDVLFSWRLGYEPENGDIVTFDAPEEYGEKGDYWIKRVIATEGQTVKIDYDSNSVYVDGQKLNETYLGEEMEEDGDINEITVPEGYVFVLGDNRNDSKDSRFVGCINKEDLLGKSVFRIWPLKNIGKIN